MHAIEGHHGDEHHGDREHHEVHGVRDNLTVHGNPDLSHLDETPFEHAHSDYESRFVEHDVVPHHERAHDEHGIETEEHHESREHHSHASHMPSLPSYEELLWAY